MLHYRARILKISMDKPFSKHIFEAPIECIDQENTHSEGITWRLWDFYVVCWVLTFYEFKFLFFFCNAILQLMHIKSNYHSSNNKY